LGQVEDRLRQRIPFALDPAATSAQGVVDSAQRALNPFAGRDARDSQARASRLRELLDSVTPAASIPMESVLPGLGPHPAAPFEEQEASTVSQADLFAFVEKIVRGQTYLDLGAYIDDRYAIHIQPIDPRDSGFLTSQLDRFGHLVDLGPGLRIRVVRADQDPIAAIFEIVLWETLTIYAIVHHAGVGESVA
jgi:hypothetical protein